MISGLDSETGLTADTEIQAWSTLDYNTDSKLVTITIQQSTYANYGTFDVKLKVKYNFDV